MNVLVIHGSSGICQNTYKQFIADLNIEFNKNEIKKFEKAAKMLDEANAILDRSNFAYKELDELDIKERSSAAYEHALKMLFDASETYKEAYGLAYSVLRDRGDEFWNDMLKANHRAAGMDKAIYYQRTATGNMNRSLIRHEQVLESDRFVYSVNILKDALSLDKLAIRNAGRSVQICTDYPVEYNYGWDDDKTLEQVIELLKDPNVNEPPDDIFATLNEKNDVDSTLFKEIIFKVQIAAHTEPLSEEYLSSLYKGGLKIDLIFEDNWYKYSIGRYKSYDEAEATRRECKVQKAFVIAYQEGKKMGTQEAIELSEKRLEQELASEK